MKHAQIIKTILAICLLAWLPSSNAQQETPEIDWNFWFPNGVTNIKGEPVDMARLENKRVGFYFSAHWCPPCRMFTPKLVKFYEEHKDEMEIVFISADRDQKQKDKYFKEDGMSWLTIELNGEDSNRLSGGLQVSGIPALFILNKDAKIITAQGVQEIYQDPDVAWQTWRTEALAQK